MDMSELSDESCKPCKQCKHNKSQVTSYTAAATGRNGKEITKLNNLVAGGHIHFPDIMHNTLTCKSWRSKRHPLYFLQAVARTGSDFMQTETA